MEKIYFITAKDVSILFDCKIASAHRKIQLVKDSLKLKINRKITLLEFCQAYDLDFEKAKNTILH